MLAYPHFIKPILLTSTFSTAIKNLFKSFIITFLISKLTVEFMCKIQIWVVLNLFTKLIITILFLYI